MSAPSTSNTAAPPAATPRRGVEVRSIDFVPLSERHGKIWHLAPVWVAGNANVGSVAVGFVGVAAGASLMWTLIAVTAGCAFGTVFSALHSTQGPRLGLPQLIQSRPQFGYLGALFVFALALVNYVGFNVFAAVLVGQSADVTLHLPSKPVFVAVGVISGVLALVGYDWIHRVSRWITLAFTIVFVVLTAAALTSGHLHSGAFRPGHLAATAFLLQFGAAAGYQINWAIYVSDYTRYLPPTVSPRRMFWCTYLGMTLSAVWLAGLGAVLAVAYPTRDAVGAVHAAGDALLPGLGGTALLIAVAGMLVVAAMNTYGGSLTLISIADSLREVRFTTTARAVSVAAVTIAATALSLVVSQNFLADFTVFLQLLLYLFAPWTAINLTDYFLVRRGHYAISEIFNPRGIYGRLSWRGTLAYLIGFAAEIPFTSTTLYTGPVAHSLGGADLSPFVGVLIGGLAYWVTTRSLDTRTENQHTFTADSALP